MRDVSRLIPLLLLSVTLGCGSEPAQAPAECPEPAKAAEAPAPAPSEEPSIGALDKAFVAAMAEPASLAKIEKLELELNADGSVRELALYHSDDARIPDAVKAKVDEVYPGAKIKLFESELEGPERKEVFEVEVETADGQECEIEATAAGELIYTECEIEAESLDDAIKAAVKATFPGGELKEAEVVERPGAAKETAVEVEVDGVSHKLVFVSGELRRHAVEIKAEIELDLPLP
ncbi:MAG: hypothetical protein KC486_04935 [Myxococcales bacterium]|nr:hypothetical protein [Myxococcales bacterium]